MSKPPSFTPLFMDNVKSVITSLPWIAFFQGLVSVDTIRLLPTYANNTAAVAGGLKVGQMYRTGADPDLICVVH